MKEKVFSKDSDNLKIALIVMDIIGVVPFLATAIYIRPNNITLEGNPSLLLKFFALFSCSRILRVLKDIPAIWAIRITLYNAIPHLVLPIFFFLAFNIWFGVAFYFIEPCYMNSVCPWHTLFDASYYSIVSMTTSKCIEIIFNR